MTRWCLSRPLELESVAEASKRTISCMLLSFILLSMLNIFVNPSKTYRCNWTKESCITALDTSLRHIVSTVHVEIKRPIGAWCRRLQRCRLLSGRLSLLLLLFSFLFFLLAAPLPVWMRFEMCFLYLNLKCASFT